jgi:hypothetical protein
MMKDKSKRLPVAERIRKGLEEAIRHARGEITLKTTTVEIPDEPPPPSEDPSPPDPELRPGTHPG